MGASVEPRKTASKGEDLEFVGFEIMLIDRSDFQFPTSRRFDVRCHIHHRIGVEIQAHHGIVGLGVLGLFFDRGALSSFVKGGDAITLRIIDTIAKDGGALFLFGCGHGFLEEFGEASSVEDVVA